MTTNNNLDALPQDAELPFSHPGRRCDDTPEGFEPSPWWTRDRSGITCLTETMPESTTAPGTAPCAGTTA